MYFHPQNIAAFKEGAKCCKKELKGTIQDMERPHLLIILEELWKLEFRKQLKDKILHKEKGNIGQRVVLN